MKKLLAGVLAVLIAGTSHASVPIKVAPAAQAGVGALGAAGAAVRGPGSPIELTFDLTPGQIKSTFRTAKTNLVTALDAVAAVKPEDATFQNTVHALEKAWVGYTEEMAGVRVLSESPRKRVREAVEQVNNMASEMGVEQGLREDVYKAILSYAEKGEELHGEDKKLLEDTLLDFRKSGMGLAPSERDKLKKLSAKISKLVQRYESNIREWDGGIDVAPEDLEGVPAPVVGSLKKLPDGRLRVPDDGPAAGQVMSKAKSSKVRMRLYYAMQRKAAKRNIPILRKVLKLRQRQADLLGYKNYAAMKLDGRMAGSPKRVWKFLGRLRKLLRQANDAEEAEILEQKRLEHPNATKVHPWDASRYGLQHMEKTLDLNPEVIREYFPADKAVPEALKVYEELLGIEFREVPGAEVWHKEVKAYDIIDAGNGVRLGRIYMDLFARKGKRDGAWAAPLVGGRRLDDGTYREPVTAVTTNFEKGKNGKPALLRHNNVKTLFHELGHAMHMTLTTAQRRSFSGSSVAWDFVEAPSQMMENFIWRPEIIARVSGHYKDRSKPLPPDLVEKLLAARNYHSASGALGQAAMAAMDLLYYTVAPNDVLGVFRKVMKAFTGVEPHRASKFPARFGHILTGYAAGYYGYLWSRVFAQDIFSVFDADGVMSPRVGRRYRGTILANGSRIPEDESMREFLGRDPSEEAFLKWLGVAPEPDSQASLGKALERSGFTPEQLELIRANGKIESAESFLARKDFSEGGYMLGVTGRDSVYRRLASATGLTFYRDAYLELYSRIRVDVTDEFMDYVTSSGEEIVFLIPDDVLGHPDGKMTKQELEWLLAHPERMKNVRFVFGAYDLVPAHGEGKEDSPRFAELREGVIRSPDSVRLAQRRRHQARAFPDWKPPVEVQGEAREPMIAEFERELGRATMVRERFSRRLFYFQTGRGTFILQEIDRGLVLQKYPPTDQGPVREIFISKHGEPDLHKSVKSRLAHGF